MKRLFKILAWTAGIFLVLIVLAVVGLKLFLPRDKVRQLAEERASEMLKRKVTVQDIDISIWGGLGLELVGVEIASPDGFPEPRFVSAEAVDLKLALLPLLRKEIAVERFILDKPQITMFVNKDSSNNFTFELGDSSKAVTPPADMPGEAKVAAAAVSFDALEIRHGAVTYVSRPDSLTVRADDLNLTTSVETFNTTGMRSAGELSVGSLIVNDSTTIPRVAIGLEYNASIDLARDQLTLEDARLDVNGLHFTASGYAEKLTTDMTARLNLKSERMTADELFAQLPAEREGKLADYTVKGDIKIDVDLEYYSNNQEEPLVYVGSAELTDVSMSNKAISGELTFKRAMLDFKANNLRVNIEDGMFDGQPFKGHLVLDNFEDPSVDGELGGSLDLTFVKPFLPAGTASELEGKSDFELKFSGRPSEFEKMRFSGNVTIEEGRYNSQLLPEPLTDLSLSAYFDNRIVNIRSLDANFASGSVNFSGRASDLLAYLMADSTASATIEPEFDGTIKGKSSLSVLNKMMPRLEQASLGGTAAFDLKVTAHIGRKFSMRPFGSVSITDGKYNDPLLPEPIEQFEAGMQLTPDSIIFKDLSVKFPSSDVTLKGTLADPLPYVYSLIDTTETVARKPFFVFSLASHRFNADRLFPEVVPGVGGEEKSPQIDSVSIVFLPDIDGAGTLHVDTLVYSAVEFTGIDGRIRIKDRRIECYDVAGAVYTGKVTGKTTIDLNDFENPLYSGSFEASGVEINDFVSRFTRFDSTVFGKGNISGDYSAHGWEPDSILMNMQMKGEGTVQSGKIIFSESAFKLLRDLSEKTGRQIKKEQPLNNLRTAILVENGRVHTDNLKTKLPEVGDLEIGGSYGFDESLDYQGSLLLNQELSEKLTAKGGVLGELSGLLSSDDQKRIALPVTVTGTITSPKFNLDYTAIAKQAGKKVEDKAGDLLKGLFKKK